MINFCNAVCVITVLFTLAAGLASQETEIRKPTTTTRNKIIACLTREDFLLFDTRLKSRSLITIIFLDVNQISKKKIAKALQNDS